MLITVVIIIAPFAVIGAMMAWLISYDELVRHFPDRRTPALEASRRAFTVLVFLLALGALAGLVLSAAHT